MSVTHPDEVAVIDNSRDPQWYDAWRINVISGARTRVFENAGSFQDFVFDHSLTPRIGLHYNDDASVAAFRLNGGEVDDLLLTIPTSATRTTDFLGFDSTNQYVYLLGHHGSDKSSFTRVGLDHGEVTTIAQGGMADIRSVLLEPVSGMPEAYSEHYVRDEWFPLSDRVGSDLRLLSEELEGDYRIIDRTIDDGYWLLFSSGPRHPGTYQ